MKTLYGITNNEYTTVEGVDKLLNADKLGSLLDISDSNEIEIIVPTIKVLSKTLNGITQLLNTIHDKGFKFKSLEDDIDSTNQREFDLFVNHLNTFNNIALEQAYEREQQIRQGGKKRGKRETFQFPSDWEQIYERMITGQMTKTEMVEHYGVSRQSIYCWINRYEKQLREESRK
mgnify:FL=1